eukprot:UN21439
MPKYMLAPPLLIYPGIILFKIEKLFKNLAS